MANSPREGDWQCPNGECINHVQFPNSFVYASKVNCPKCGTGKTAKRAGDWCCPNVQCVNHNNTVYGSKAVCQRCGTPKPPLGGKGGVHAGGMHGGMQVLLMQPGMAPQTLTMAPQVAGHSMRQGDWHCPNPTCKNHSGGNYVYGSKQVCGVCGTARPAGNGGVSTALPMVHQPQYQVTHMQPQFQAQQFQPVQYQVPQQMTHQQPQFYATSQPVRPGGHLGLKSHPGDWHCPNSACKNFSGNVVYASKTHCPLCNTAKPVAAATVEARPMGRRHEGDWQCPTPGCKNNTNFVYASKPACTICGAPNPNLDPSRARSRSPRGG